MDVILISLAICILGVMVTVLLFSAAMRTNDKEDDSTPRANLQPPPERFFMEEKGGSETEPESPTNSLMLDLERHVRTELDAAEAFLRGPTFDSLHAPSDSPLWN